MKKLSIIVFLLLTPCFLFAGDESELLSAKYYVTEYWGETKEVKRGSFKYWGREWKTHRIHPKSDFKVVKEEKKNGDNLVIAALWYSEGSDAVGLFFDDITKEGRYNLCGTIVFTDWNAVKKFFHEFKGTGENIDPYITQTYGIDCDRYLFDLNSQIAESADKEVGE